MKTHTLKTKQWLPRPLDEVFLFFANAHNLEAITPPWLHFKLLTLPPIEMKQGTLINYRLRPHGVPMRWQSEITSWNPPHDFVDEQRRGPYRLWIHKHTFVQCNGGTLIEDKARYAVYGGALIQNFLVAPDLKKIFDYRRHKLQQIFGEG